MIGEEIMPLKLFEALSHSHHFTDVVLSTKILRSFMKHLWMGKILHDLTKKLTVIEIFKIPEIF